MTENKIQDAIYGEGPVTDAVLLMGAANEIRRRDIKILELEALLKQAREALLNSHITIKHYGGPDLILTERAITAIDKFLEDKE